MKILGLDSSGLVAGVAVVEDDNLLAEYTVNYKKTHSQTLLPMLDAVVKMIELDINTIDAIAVTGGPGSFTGLRIGSATAKGLGFALKKPLIQIPTVDGLAYNLYGSKDMVCPIMDARRNQTYTGLYEFTEDGMEVLLAQCAVEISEIIEKINERNRSVIFLGDGVPVFRNYIQEHCQVSFSFAPAHLNKQRAAAVAALAFTYYQEGKIETAAEHRPDYLRLSQAERERLAQEHSEKADS
ncbi:MAG: tRNA (adenosine(37)-N6)-threonylcarbamoyltransferase complex dimerization subunit type 1 TsaB [Lachnospiraceae bacterium]|nr:tRNA (adenosine(37)-N6)-threonylcarbamoyltransferase complex dimerization subunit type 1 TsaB [Lachnospiraceae bacterium]